MRKSVATLVMTRDWCIAFWFPQSWTVRDASQLLRIGRQTMTIPKDVPKPQITISPSKAMVAHLILGETNSRR